MLGWLGNIDPPDFYYDQHHSGGANNYQGFSDDEVDRLLDAGLARSPTPRSARRSTAQAAERIVDLASYVYLYNPDVVQGWSPDLEGYEPRGDRAIRFDQAPLSGG